MARLSSNTPSYRRTGTKRTGTANYTRARNQWTSDFIKVRDLSNLLEDAESELWDTENDISIKSIKMRDLEHQIKDYGRIYLWEKVRDLNAEIIDDYNDIRVLKKRIADLKQKLKTARAGLNRHAKGNSVNNQILHEYGKREGMKRIREIETNRRLSARNNRI